MTQMAEHSQPTSTWTQRLLAAEQQWVMQNALAQEHLVWVQGAGLLPADTESNGLRLSVNADGECLTGDVIMRSAQWPLLSDSLDGVILHHVSETGADLFEWMPEVARVLKPEASVWVFTTGLATQARHRLLQPDTSMRSWLRPMRSGRLAAMLQALGCVEVAHTGFRFDDNAVLRQLGAVRPWHGLSLIQARKRRCAIVMRPKAFQRMVSAPVTAMNGLPASRVGLAA